MACSAWRMSVPRLSITFAWCSSEMPSSAQRGMSLRCSSARRCTSLKKLAPSTDASVARFSATFAARSLASWVSFSTHASLISQPGCGWHTRWSSGVARISQACSQRVCCLPHSSKRRPESPMVASRIFCIFTVSSLHRSSSSMSTDCPAACRFSSTWISSQMVPRRVSWRARRSHIAMSSARTSVALRFLICSSTSLSMVIFSSGSMSLFLMI
mmetsp:Transcript_23069/g.50589  ORF Transcript_23069/g.50589 Transcript_23069/m.50589 type:complete len:214 (+) Transcript_23069:266-907(+)